MVIGLFGGTFDPLHNGHLSLVDSALASGLVQRLIIMPTGSPPHKKNQVVSMAGYRYEMVCQTFKNWPAVEISDLEIRREGPSYTVDTVKQLQADLSPGDELVLIYGSDVLHKIESWHRPAELMAACQLLVANRGGQRHQDDVSQAEHLRRRYGALIRFFPAPVITLSSREIREAVRNDWPYQHLLPESVVRVIRRHEFYSGQGAQAELPVALRDQLSSLERELWTLLDRKRLLHSLNVMIYAAHLATVHEAELDKACVAALLHDCAKCLPQSEVLAYARRAGDQQLLEPALAHGPAGAWLAKTQFGIDDPAVLRAIHFHTTGCADMSTLDKIIFIADKVEPARTYDNLDMIRHAAEKDLDASLLVCIYEIEKFLQRENLSTHPYTLAAKREVENRQQMIGDK
ncbi:MAG: nicotinate-nucleotide adenylyltransferase [Saccharofermentanales bacterium]